MPGQAREEPIAYSCVTDKHKHDQTHPRSSTAVLLAIMRLLRLCWSRSASCEQSDESQEGGDGDRKHDLVDRVLLVVVEEIVKVERVSQDRMCMPWI